MRGVSQGVTWTCFSNGGSFNPSLSFPSLPAILQSIPPCPSVPSCIFCMHAHMEWLCFFGAHAWQTESHRPSPHNAGCSWQIESRRPSLHSHP